MSCQKFCPKNLKTDRFILKRLSKQTPHVPPRARKGELYTLFHNFKVKTVHIETRFHYSKIYELSKILPQKSKNGSFYFKRLSKQTPHVPLRARKGELYTLFHKFQVKTVRIETRFYYSKSYELSKISR